MPYSPLPVKSFQSVCQIIGIQHFSKNARMNWSSWICVHIFRFLASLLLTFWVYWNAWKALQEIVKNYRLLLWWRRIRIHERVHPFVIPSRKIPYANKHCIPLCLTISISAEKDIEQFSLEQHKCRRNSDSIIARSLSYAKHHNKVYIMSQFLINLSYFDGFNWLLCLLPHSHKKSEYWARIIHVIGISI